MRKVIITAALTGMIYNKKDNPNLPEQPDEIVRQAQECREAGAAIVHLHARDKEGAPTMDVAIVRALHDRIRAKTDLVMELSTSGALELAQADQMESLGLAPEMASLNLVPTILEWGGQEQLFANPRSEVHRMAREMLANKIKPEMEVVNFAALQEVEMLIREGLVAEPYYVNLAFGLPEQGALEPDPHHLVSLVKRLPIGSLFNVTSHGLSQLPMTTMAVLMGGHVRVGLEDNVFYRDGELAAGNSQLVARSARIIRELGYEVATPEDARDILGISS
jgi:3-keto-5-aminohexanoate cleavage enzyme